MALTLPLPFVNESRAYLGLGQEEASYLVVPGVSDYPANGYVIKAIDCRLTRILGVSVEGANAAAVASGYTPVISLSYTYAANSVAQAPTQFLFALINTTLTIAGGAAGTAIGITADANGAALTKAAATTRTGITGPVATDAAVGASFSGSIWVVRVRGY